MLLDADVRLTGPDGIVDRAASCTAMRSGRVDGGRVVLDERPLQLRLVLDQGSWSETGLTPPDLQALERDVELTQALGFNGVRKHQSSRIRATCAWPTSAGRSSGARCRARIASPRAPPAG